jgi:ribosome maturation factor RimP
VAELIERTVEGLGYEFVEAERAGGGLLRVTLDAPQAAGGVCLDDCERVSRQLTRVLEVEGVDYSRLEVSSPGLDRRLAKARDFARFAGHQVQIELIEPLEGKRRLRGRLVGLAGESGAEQVRVELDDAVAPQSPKARGPRALAGKRTASKKAPAAPARVVEVALASIGKARLVPELQFGSKR